MHSIPIAIAWGIYRRGRWHFLTAALGAGAASLIVLNTLNVDDLLHSAEYAIVMAHVTLLLIAGVTYAAALMQALGHPAQYRTWPLSPAAIAAVQLVPAMLGMSVAMVGTQVAINAGFDLDWPIYGPALYMAVAFALFLALYWLIGESLWHLCVLLAPSMSLIGLWLHSRYGLVWHSGPIRYWQEVTPGEAATLLAASGLAYLVATRGIARQRCGERLQAPQLLRHLGELLDPTPKVGTPFRSPRQAQFWFEWRQKGWLMPIGVGGVLVVGFCAWLLFNRAPQDLVESVANGGVLLAVGGVVFGLVMGDTGATDTTLGMGSFLATRPLTSADMARCTLKMAGISVCMTWSIWAAADLAIRGTFFGLGTIIPADMQVELGWAYLPATLFGTWMSTMIVSTIVQTGRAWLLGVVGGAAFSLFIATELISRSLLTHDPQLAEVFISATGYVQGGIYVAATAWAFWAGLRRGLISPEMPYIAAGLWATSSGAIIVASRMAPDRPLATMPLLIGIAALTAFPLAAMPLALAWNRHR